MAKILPFEYSTAKRKITVKYSEFLTPLGKALIDWKCMKFWERYEGMIYTKSESKNTARYQEGVEKAAWS